MDSRMMICVGVLIGGASVSAQDLPEPPAHPDAVVSRVFEHFRGVPGRSFSSPNPGTFTSRSGDECRVLSRSGSIGQRRVEPPRPMPSSIYRAPRSCISRRPWCSGPARHTIGYVWCLLAAVLAHESAHTALNTERQALTAELGQLRRCLFAGHLHATDGWNATTYLGKVEARLRNPREHR